MLGKLPPLALGYNLPDLRLLREVADLQRYGSKSISLAIATAVLLVVLDCCVRLWFWLPSSGFPQPRRKLEALQISIIKRPKIR
jgi:hypothetical protein